MSSEPITIYKLIILYTLSKVDAPLPPSIISDYITDRGYTNYFTLQNAFGELLQADLIREDATYHVSYYYITDAGRETLELFGTPLSHDIRSEIDSYLQENRYEIIDETSLVTDYRQTPEKTYLATCTIREKQHTLFRIELDVATERDAIKICENWQEQSEELYRMAMLHLLS